MQPILFSKTLLDEQWAGWTGEYVYPLHFTWQSKAWSYNLQTWHHPGGKLRELGAQALTDAELLAILISSGIKGKPAETIAQEVIDRFGSLSGMARQPLEAFLQFKGLSDVKIIRIAAAFEIARRMVKEAARGEEK